MTGFNGAKAHVARGVGRLCDLVITSGKGSWVRTADNRKLLDFTTGIGVVNTGHCHPAVVAAAQEQVGKLIHGQVNVAFHDKMLELTDTLLQPGMVPAGLDTVFYASTGSESVENALKIARVATGKQGVIVMRGGFHGRTVGTMSMTTSNRIYRQKFGPLMPGVTVTAFPDLVRGIDSDKAMKDLELVLKTQCHEDEVACLIMEPVLGEGGYIPAPADFLQRVQRFCNDKGIMFIMDEVQTGFGRTGSLFACDSDYYGHVTPDIITMAKGIASGFPLSAVVTTKAVADKCDPGMLGGTYSANAVACAAALATQKVIKEEGMVENADKQGKAIMARLEDLKARRPDIVRDVRGRGLMIGVEFTDAVPVGTKAKLSQKCLDNGMLLLGTSVYETMRFIPPLNISNEDVMLGCDIFEKSLDEVLLSMR